MGRPVVHWEIWAEDTKKLAEFYSKLFDWKVDFNNPINYGLVETGGQGGINGGIMKPQRGPHPHRLTFYVQVDDLQACLDKAESLGGKTIFPPTAIPGVGSYALFSDPEGVYIGLFKP